MKILNDKQIWYMDKFVEEFLNKHQIDKPADREKIKDCFYKVGDYIAQAFTENKDLKRIVLYRFGKLEVHENKKDSDGRIRIQFWLSQNVRNPEPGRIYEE